MRAFTRPLPSVVPHRHDEPAYALLLRNGLHNGMLLTNTLFDMASLTERQRVSRLDPQHIARICKADPEAVERATPKVDAETVRLFDHVLSAEDFSVDRRRWCPACLKEDPYHRVWWDVQAITTCPDHGIELASDCGCGKPLRWRHTPLVRCDLAHDLRRVERRPASPSALAHDAYFLGRLIPERFVSVPALDGVALRYLSVHLTRLGKASLNEARSLHKLRTEMPARALQAEGFRIASDLPGAFERLLDGFLAGADERGGKRGVARAYGHDFFYWVTGLGENSLGTALSAILAEHARANVDLKNRTRFGAGDVVAYDDKPISAACEEVGMTYDRFVAVLARLGIEPRSMLEGTRLTLAPAEWDDLRERLAGWRNLRQVCAELAVFEADVVELARSGRLPVLAEGTGSAEWVFPRDAAGTLMGAIRDASGKFVGEDWRYEPLPRVARMLGSSVAEVVGLVLDGRLDAKLRGRLKSGLPAIVVPKPQLRDLLAETRDGAVPLRAVGRRLGLEQSALDAVVHAGLLVPTRVGDVDMVTDEQVAAFVEAFATMPELREVAGARNFQVVAGALAGAGVHAAAAGPALFDAVYPRAAAMAVARELAARVVPKAEAERPRRKRNEIAADLMMTPLMLRQVVEAGHLRMREGCPFGSIPDEEIEAFRARYATISDLTKKFGHTGFRTVVGILNQAGVEPLCQRPAFDAMLFDREPAEAALKAAERGERAEKREAKAISSEPHLSVEEAVAELGAARNMVLQLVQTGILPARKDRGYLIPKSAIEAFKEEYILGNELGRMAGRVEGRGSGKAITERLIARGLKPVCSRPEFYSYLFRREEAVAAVAAMPRVECR